MTTRPEAESGAPRQAELTIEILSCWHAGTGRGQGGHVDAVTLTGPDGLPRIEGKHIKGLLRDAMYRAEAWQHVEAGMTHRLFGGWQPKDGKDPTRHDSIPGALRFGSARLADARLEQWLAHPANDACREALFVALFSTAISRETGTAKTHSLRGQQVVIPLTLKAPVTCGPEAPAHWKALLAGVLPLVRAVGADRSRGLGRARLSLSGVEESP